jgi:hypothetical protein
MLNANKPCTCGAGVPVVAPGGTRKLGHTSNCARMAERKDAAAPPTGDSPYADVEYARTLIKRAEALAPDNSVLAEFLLRLAAEARLLAELQGRWEYES